MGRIDAEKRTVERMIRMYCRRKEGNGDELCDVCRDLMAYCMGRLDGCPHGETKPTCRRCTIHCYRADRREKIREVMRYAGPRMIFHYPVDALRHLFREFF